MLEILDTAGTVRLCLVATILYSLIIVGGLFSNGKTLVVVFGSVLAVSARIPVLVYSTTM